MSRLLAAVLVAIFAGHALGQESKPSFAVASVEPSEGGRGSSFYGAQASGCSAFNVPLSMFIESAYGLRAYQVVGGPRWIHRDLFSVTAKYPAGFSIDRPGARDEALLMVQGLLANRFKLRVHKETQEGTTYAMLIARADRRLGPKLLSNAESCGPNSTRDAVEIGWLPPMYGSTDAAFAAG